MMSHRQIRIPNAQKYFWTKEWQAAEQMAEEDIMKKRTRGPFRNMRDFKAALRRP